MTLKILKLKVWIFLRISGALPAFAFDVKVHLVSFLILVRYVNDAVTKYAIHVKYNKNHAAFSLQMIDLLGYANFAINTSKIKLQNNKNLNFYIINFIMLIKVNIWFTLVNGSTSPQKITH
jgi:hypothetical protein